MRSMTASCPTWASIAAESRDVGRRQNQYDWPLSVATKRGPKGLLSSVPFLGQDTAAFVCMSAVGQRPGGIVMLLLSRFLRCR